MTILMCLTWLILFTLTLLAFQKGKIFISSPQDILQETAKRRERAFREKEKYDLESALMVNSNVVVAFAEARGVPVREGVGAVGGSERSGQSGGGEREEQNGVGDHVNVTIEHINA